MLFTYPCFLTDPPSWVEADPPAPNAPTFPEEEEEEEEEPDCCRRSWAKTTAEKTITSVKANKAAKSLIFMTPVFGGFSSQLYVQGATKIQIHVSGQRNPSRSQSRKRAYTSKNSGPRLPPFPIWSCFYSLKVFVPYFRPPKNIPTLSFVGSCDIFTCGEAVRS